MMTLSFLISIVGATDGLATVLGLLSLVDAL
jgi:hypothetical protein